MKELSRQSPNYRNLAARGVSVNNLTPVSFWESRWRVTVPVRAHVEADALKRLVEAFLEAEFEASEFKWYRAKNDPTGLAFCYFKTFCM